jgi:hypothetical protein
MANFIFGDVDEIVCQHTTGEFRFFPKANEDFTINRGGKRASDDSNEATANGQNMVKINYSKWKVEGPIAVDTVNDTEMNILDALSSHPDDGVWTFSLTSGAVYKGTGRPVGEQAYSTNSGTMPIIISGGGKLEKI